MGEFFKLLLITLRVVKSKGKDSSGKYITEGAYRWNPLSWLIVITIGIIVALGEGCSTFVEYLNKCWAD